MSTEQLIQSINQRIDEHYSLLLERLRGLEESTKSFHAMIESRLDAHEDYHRRNEHRFGLMRLAQRNPLRLALLAFALGGIMLSSGRLDVHWFASLAERIVRQLLGF